MMNNSSEIQIDFIPYFNYTFYLNGYSFLRQIKIENITSNYENVSLRINSSLGLFQPYVLHVDRIGLNSICSWSKFDLEIDLAFLKRLSEKDVDAIQVSLYSADVELISKIFNIGILPIDYFGGLQVYPELLASYVLSNHTKIFDLKTAAIQIMEKNNLVPSFEGYQQASKERILQMVSSLYKAIQNLGLIYSALPASFENQGQRIRLIDMIMETKFGNCIDISLLFAACLEAIGLNPIVILTRGHAFVGVWLEDQRFDTAVNYDQSAISKRIAAGNKELIVIESTNLCRGNSLTINEAMQYAERQVLDAHNFLLSIDIKSARALGIKPLPVLNENEIHSSGANATDYVSESLDDAYDLGPIYDDLMTSDTNEISKQKLWERKLLDLSLRNSLLNLRFTKSMLQIVDTKANLLEDSLIEGKSYSIQPNIHQTILRKYNLYSGPLHATDPLFKLAEEEFKYNRLLTNYHEEDLNSILTNLYRTSKLAEEENGRSTLYLGLGLLKWFEPRNKVQARTAPIILIPVELHRRSVSSKFNLRSREEDTMINITLLEYLKQEFKLNLDVLEHLPMDEKGVDVAKVFAIIRNAVLNLEGWDVLEQTVLGIFSFNKLLLWQDISKYSDEIQKSPIVRSLIEGKLNEEFLDTDSEIDVESIAAQDLTLPIPTDNSQLNAIKKASLNKTFVLHGPPGTGKSQTITNIIADALSKDKKVLFVAAKKAALDVVHKRLEGIGLGPFCLELHSNKAKKSDILAQFDEALQVPKYHLAVDFLDEAKRLDERKAGLRKFVDELHQKNGLNWSLFETISFLENNKVPFNQSLSMDMKTADLSIPLWNNWNDWLVPFSSLVLKMKSPFRHPLAAIKLTQHQFEYSSQINNAIEQYKLDLSNADILFKEYDIDPLYIFKYAEVLEILKNKNVNIRLCNYYFELEKAELFRVWLDLSTSKTDIERELHQDFNRSILGVNFDALEVVWNQSKHAWFLPRWFKRYKVKNQLAGYAKHKLKNDAVIDNLFAKLPSYRGYKQELSHEKYSSFSSVVHTYMDGEFLKTTEIREDYATIDRINHLLKEANLNDVESWLRRNLIDKKIAHQLSKLIDLSSNLLKSSNQLLQYLTSLVSLENLLNIQANLNLLEDRINYNIFKNKAADLDLNWFVQFVENELVDVDNLVFEFEKIIRLNHFVERLYGENTLNSFDGSIYESLIDQYKLLHRDFINISNSQLIMKLSSKIPNANMEAVQSSEIGFLQRAIRSKGRGLSIRKLFDQIPSLIPRMKPCMLMSPISVAQYFNVNRDHFDLVIFDEASQLPTSEAISALARAKQAIIVGDPKQMPPTSFFSSTKVDEENYEIEDLESILEDTLSLSIPSNYLLKHYRSKHESLISFSNKNFYDSKLMTFPSPDDLNQKVTFDYVEGHYDKGKTRTNKNEAKQVIEYIKNHLQMSNKKTLGVVTFSQTQQSLVEDLLQKLYQENPTLEEFALKLEEPIFIKNLENVQGDERDIILFSIGYGPDEYGKVSMNFGPLNREGGWRRLNVAITRARYEMKVFSSLRADHIDLNRTNSEGVKALKGFLHFAEKGDLEINHIAEALKKSSLIDAIEEQLVSRGYRVKKHIGTSQFKLDLGIVHPYHENVYILGLLIDGENYFNINNTNDRELLTPNVLKSLSWNLFRVWTLDWIKHKERILDTISTKINAILDKEIQDQSLKIKDEEMETKLEEVDVHINDNETRELLIEIDHSEYYSSKKQAYVEAKFKALKNANSESIYFPENRIVLQRQVEQLVQLEAPISTNLLIKKILKFWNIARAGAKLNEYFYQIIADIPSIRKTYDEAQEFLWTEGNSSETLDYFRDNSVEKRAIDDICSAEIKIALLEIMDHNISMTKEDLIRLASRAFSFQKVGSQIEFIISNAINSLVDSKKLDFVGGKLYIPM